MTIQELIAAIKQKGREIDIKRIREITASFDTQLLKEFETDIGNTPSGLSGAVGPLTLREALTAIATAARNTRAPMAEARAMDSAYGAVMDVLKKAESTSS